MAIEVGTRVDGTVSGITKFGAFVDLGEHQSGLVHISEVSEDFIEDIHTVLTVGDSVKVKVLSKSDDGKIALSIKKAIAKPAFKPRTPAKAAKKTEAQPDFDKLLSGFLKDSESRLSTLKKNTDGKRGGRGGRRS